MEKKVIEIDEVNYEVYKSSGSKCTISIEELLGLINNSVKCGANTVELMVNVNWGMSYVESIGITSLKTRLETDEEFAIRKAKHEAKLDFDRKKQMEKDLAEYERLKKIFEG